MTMMDGCRPVGQLSPAVVAAATGGRPSQKTGAAGGERPASEPGLHALAQPVVGVVRAAAVLGHVQAGLLLLRTDPQLVEHLEHEEQQPGPEHGPGGDDQHAHDLGGQELAAAARVERAKVAVEVCLVGVVRRREQPGDDDAPRAAHAVHRRRAEGVVDAQLQPQPAGDVKDNGADPAGDHGGPRLQHGAAGGDRHKADERAVAHGEQVPCTGAPQRRDERDDHGGGAGQRGGDGGAAGGEEEVLAAGLGGGDDVEGRSGVEAVPAEPQENGA